MRERTLDRLIRIGLVVVVIGIGIEVSDYFLDWRNGEDSLLERQITATEEAVREQPNETGLRLRLAETYRVADRPDSALEQYDEVLKLEEDQSRRSSGPRGARSSPGSIHSSRPPTSASARRCWSRNRPRRR